MMQAAEVESSSPRGSSAPVLRGGRLSIAAGQPGEGGDGLGSTGFASDDDNNPAHYSQYSEYAQEVGLDGTAGGHGAGAGE